MLKSLRCPYSFICRTFASTSLNETKPKTFSRKKLKDAARSVKLGREEHRKLANKYDMPKHPGTVFNIFFADAFPEFSGGWRTEEHGRKWHELSDEQKKEYSKLHHEKVEIYRQKLQEWRENMIANGREKIVGILEFGKSWQPNSYAPETRHDQTSRQLALENEKPKYPTPAFNRFRQHISSISPEVVKVQECRQLWENLPADEKTEYKNQFRVEYVAYQQKMREWKAQMITSGRREVVKKLESVYNRTPLPSNFDKPRYPTRPIDRFLAEISAETAEGDLSEDEKVSLWNKLTPEEREKYTEPYKSELSQYRGKLEEWKRSMIANGHEEIMKYQLRNMYPRRRTKDTTSE